RDRQQGGARRQAEQRVPGVVGGPLELTVLVVDRLLQTTVDLVEGLAGGLGDRPARRVLAADHLGDRGVVVALGVGGVGGGVPGPPLRRRVGRGLHRGAPALVVGEG